MTSGAPIRVIVVDDHPVFRRGLRTLVEDSDGLEFVAEAADGDDAVRLCRDHRPDVVLMDIRMPGTSGVEATRKALAERPELGVLMLTMLEDDTSLFAALRAGARGYVLKGAAPDEIVRAIIAVAAGEALFGPAVARRLAGFLQPDRRTHSHAFPTLSPRERDILELIAAGQPNATIAETLILSEKTIRNNITNIFAKLGVTDRPEAIIKARDAGLGSER